MQQQPPVSPTLYRPKQDHPWRQYRNKKVKGKNGEFETPSMKLQVFLKNIVDNWETYKIPSSNFEDRDFVSLKNISPDKQAEWLISFIKKYWLSAKGALVYE